MRRTIRRFSRNEHLTAQSIGLCAIFVVLMSIPGATQSADGARISAESLPALQDPPAMQYRAYRRMHASNEKGNHEAWLECWTELDERGFRYEVVSERGSQYVIDKVLKTVLKREQELFAEGQADRADLTAANYDFTDSDLQQEGERVVLLKPKRKDPLLVDGRMVLNEDGTELLRVEGRLSKNPSFWTSLVKVIRHFIRVDGVRVPIATETVAKVKFAGTGRLEMEYEYETINGHSVSRSVRSTMAAARSR